MQRRGLTRAVRAAAVGALLALGGAGCGDDGGDEGAASADRAASYEGPAGLEQAEWGELLFRNHGCTACHTITGSRSVGGPLDGLIGKRRPLEDGTEVVADPEYLRRSIVEPQAQVVEGYRPQMPSYEGRLSEAEVQALVAYLRSLR